MKLFLITLLIFLPLFLLRYFQTQPKFSPGQRVRISATIVTEPLLKDNQQIFTVSRVRVYAPRFPEFNYGDKIVVTGTVRKGEKVLYLKEPEITLLNKAGILPSIRGRILELFRRTLPELESALLAGVTLGAKESLTTDFSASLKNSGMLHVVVASGMNVTLVARVLMGSLIFFFTRKLAIPATLTGIWLYVALIGLSPPIIRAAIMGSLAFTAQELGRLLFAWWSLFLSAVAMLLIWPNWIFDVGFLLSFAATAGILAFEQPIKNRLSYLLKRVTRGAGLPAQAGPAATLMQDLSTSLAAQICTTPILFVAFGQLSPWSPIMNALLLWTIPPMTILGFLGGFLGILLEPLGRTLILLSYPLSFIFVQAVALF
ncbi:ComEC/Rec2 family competence protein [Candidatus Microgenomates bacterium]|nr:ComEC/Rec2 family competence protein [Candidatus Microgenomates bacterium]